MGSVWAVVALAGCSEGSDEDDEGATSSGSSQPESRSDKLVIRDVRIFDGERLIDADSVIVAGGLITSVGLGLEPPSSARIHEGGGATPDVHVSTWEAAAIAASADADLPAHVPQDALTDEQHLSALVEADMAVVATLAVVAALSCTDDGTALLDDPAIAPHLSPAQRDGLNRELRRCLHGTLSTALDNVAALHEAGVPIRS